MCYPCSKVADSGDIATQKQRFAKFGTRVPAYTMPLVFAPRRNRISLEVERRGAYQLSPGLRRTSQQLVKAIVRKSYVHWPTLVDTLPVPWCARFSVNELLKWPSIIYYRKDMMVGQRRCMLGKPNIRDAKLFEVRGRVCSFEPLLQQTHTTHVIPGYPPFPPRSRHRDPSGRRASG